MAIILSNDNNRLLILISVPLLAGNVSRCGNKEIYDNIRSSTLSTMDKYFRVYDGGIQALESVDYPFEIVYISS